MCQYWASTGPVVGRCCQHWPSTDPVLALPAGYRETLNDIIDSVNVVLLVPGGEANRVLVGITLSKIFEIFVHNPIEILGFRIVAPHLTS